MSSLFPESLQAGDSKIYLKTEPLKPVEQLAKDTLTSISDARFKGEKTSYTLLRLPFGSGPISGPLNYSKKDIKVVMAELAKRGFSVQVQSTHVGEDVLKVTEN